MFAKSIFVCDAYCWRPTWLKVDCNYSDYRWNKTSCVKILKQNRFSIYCIVNDVTLLRF